LHYIKATELIHTPAVSLLCVDLVELLSVPRCNTVAPVLRRVCHAVHMWQAACLGRLLLNPWWRAFTMAKIYLHEWCSMAAPICISRECTVLPIIIIILITKHRL